MRIERELERGEEAEKKDKPLGVRRGRSSGPSLLAWMCAPACPSPVADVSGSAQRLTSSRVTPIPYPPLPLQRIPRQGTQRSLWGQGQRGNRVQKEEGTRQNLVVIHQA